MTLSHATLLDCAVEAARQASGHALRNLHRRREVHRAFDHDVKLLLDLECQARAEEVIRSAYPQHAIMGEEGDTPAADGQPVWVIDPIDGTVNYTHGLPYWCCSIAVQVGGRSVAGVVAAPALGETYVATTESPALLNGEPVRVSDTAQLREALAMTGLATTLDGEDGTLDVTRAVARAVRKVRLMGAAALDICQIAAGRADAFFESGLYLWDVAAGSLIVERAGGRVEPMELLPGGRRRYLVTNGRIHEPFRAIIRATRPSSGS